MYKGRDPTGLASVENLGLVCSSTLARGAVSAQPCRGRADWLIITIMGLLTIIRKQRRKEREMRILMLGLDNAGKTTLVRRLKGDLDLSKVMPTLGFNIDTLIHRSYSLNIWDIGGQKTLRPYWRNYFESTDAIIWVIDSTDRARLSDTSIELNQLLLEERLAGASLLVFANKHDLAGALSLEEIEQSKEKWSDQKNCQALALKAKPTGHRYRIMACSAISVTKYTSVVDYKVYFTIDARALDAITDRPKAGCGVFSLGLGIYSAFALEKFFPHYRTWSLIINRAL
ncbi:hypothetical protein PTTG_02942 [Puccinia triticina 1-1 BBBD Race 1]|uniref:ADP-ribosylation factor n=1 Tax=Puccinia triticina (isolate 1-1 / race 1 (BBBD)) TaxID=630390 RepID=A0A0C4EQ84_PUCT1|nr:hypothetical protein PTTG_02942 [Puccinia triticina 1-1 BBBD Race 1]